MQVVMQVGVAVQIGVAAQIVGVATQIVGVDIPTPLNYQCRNSSYHVICVTAFGSRPTSLHLHPSAPTLASRSTSPSKHAKNVPNQHILWRPELYARVQLLCRRGAVRVRQIGDRRVDCGSLGRIRGMA
jgi:hypothetical protein